jgi:hypothetical protein
MQALTLPARRGWRWLADGFGIFRKNRLMLSLAVLGYWMLMVLINSFPLIGKFAATLLFPVFSVSLMNACRMIDQGNPLTPPILFSGFRRNLRPLLVLGVVYGVVSVVILGIVALIDSGVLFQYLVLGNPPDDQALSSADFLLAVQLALLLYAPIIMAYWYAPVLVAWHDLPAGKALFFSFVACLRNWRAFLVYALSVMVFGALLPGLMVGLLISMIPAGGNQFSILLTLLIVLIFMPSLYASFYVTYRDVFVSVNEDA